jgi:putative hydrolase of the HAD superfamily
MTDHRTPPPRRLPALVFDFGNVVAHFDYATAAASLGRRLGLSGPECLARLDRLGLDGLVKRYEVGGLAAEEFSSAVCALAGVAMGHDEFAASWCAIFRPNEPVARLVAGLKAAGHTLVLGSNTNGLHAAHFRRQFAETLAHFDGLVLSYEVGHLKPAAEFYLACARAARAAPAECVFIDDLPANVAGARAAGMTGILYRDPGALAADLTRLGVNPVGTERINRQPS